MTVRVLYFDDDEKDRQIYGRRLTRGGVEVHGQAPPPDLSMDILREHWDLFLVDYELTGGPAGERANYRGGTLAMNLREHLADFPVVLFTRRNLLPDRDSHVLDALQVFDDVVFKGDADDDPPEIVARLGSLGNGFQLLRDSERTWDGAVALIGATEEEMPSLQEAAPPLTGGVWETSSLARWMMRTLLAYPGPLMDDLYAASLLGITTEAFRSESVQDLFAATSYDGILRPSDGRWWRDRLLQIARGLALDADLTSPAYASFAPAFLQATGQHLAIARCVHCNEAPADTACYVLRAPVKTEHSLLYYPDPRPGSMEPARVSFKAIRENNEVDEELIDPNARDLLVRLHAEEAT